MQLALRAVLLALLHQVEVVVQGVGVELLIGRKDARVAGLAAVLGLALAAFAAALLLLLLIAPGRGLRRLHLLQKRQRFLHVHVQVGEALLQTRFLAVLLLVLLLLQLHELLELLIAQEFLQLLLLIGAHVAGAGRTDRGLAELRQLFAAQVVLELIILGQELELAGLVVEAHARQRQLVRVERLADRFGELRPELDAVEQRLLGGLAGVDLVPLLALAGVVLVPEGVRFADPVGLHRRAVDELAEELGAVLVGLLVVGALEGRRLGGELGAAGHQEPAGQDGQNQESQEATAELVPWEVTGQRLRHRRLLVRGQSWRVGSAAAGGVPQ